jgi:hypothetical protein
MIDVYICSPSEEVAPIEALGNKMQGRFRFGREPKPGAVPVQLCETLQAGLLFVTRPDGVKVSVDQSEGISLYAGIPRPLYLLIAVLLGLVYWRILEINPLLIWEDLFVREDPECLCAARGTVQEYALAFERPWICPACLEFLRCTGAEPETHALQEVLAHALSAQERAPAETRL